MSDDAVPTDSYLPFCSVTSVRIKALIERARNDMGNFHRPRL